MPTTQRVEPSLAIPGQFERLTALLLRLPAAKRYELLKIWSLPTSGRKSIRYYTGSAPQLSPPELFVKPLPFPETRSMSTLLMLAEAAKEVGKLPELTAAAESLAKDKVENAELLKVLVYLASGKGKEIEPTIKAFAQTAHDRLTKKQEMPLGSHVLRSQLQSTQGFYPSEFMFVTLA